MPISGLVELFFYFAASFLLRGITDTLHSFCPKPQKESKTLLCAVFLADLTSGLVD